MYTVGTFLHFMSGNAKSNLNVEILKCFLKCYEGTNQGWILHYLVGGGGGGCSSCVGHVCRPPINLLDHCKVLLDYCIWIVIVVHSLLIIIMLLLKLLYLILSLIIFCFIMKNSTPPLHPLWPGLGGAPPPHPSKSIPGTNASRIIILWLFIPGHLRTSIKSWTFDGFPPLYAHVKLQWLKLFYFDALWKTHSRMLYQIALETIMLPIHKTGNYIIDFEIRWFSS
jgi:hypothetical protein